MLKIAVCDDEQNYLHDMERLLKEYCSFANSMGSQLSRKMSATKQLAKFGYQINCQSFQKI